MEILQLQEFTSLVKTLSYSETAYQLNLSTSTLSRHIQALENELSGQLFTRTTRSIELTDYGKMFLPHAVMMLQDYSTCMESLEHYRNSVRDSFALGAYYSLEEYDITGFVGNFMRTNPNYRPIISVGNMEELESGFKSKAFNVYTAVKNPDIPGLNFVKVGDCVIKVVISTEHELSKKDSLTFADLQDIPLFLPTKDSFYCRSVEDAFKRAGIKPDIRFYGRFEDSIYIIMRKLGAALFQFRTDKEMHIEGLSFKVLEPAILFEYGAGYRDNLTEGERAFIDFMKEHAHDYSM